MLLLYMLLIMVLLYMSLFVLYLLDWLRSDLSMTDLLPVHFHRLLRLLLQVLPMYRLYLPELLHWYHFQGYLYMILIMVFLDMSLSVLYLLGWLRSDLSMTDLLPVHFHRLLRLLLQVLPMYRLYLPELLHWYHLQG